MDNLTHSLVGLTISKAGLEKLSPATSVVCILAANAPDADLVTGIFGDRWTLLHYHRGLTHSIVGTLLLALIIPSIFCLGEWAISSWRRQARTLRFRGLLLASLIAGATHPLMDWTNNYGVRPLLPWNGQWFYGDLLFIVDPFVWLLLGGASFLLASRYRWQLGLWSLLAVLLTLSIAYAGLNGRALDHPAILLAIWISAVAGFVVCRSGGYAQLWGAKIAFVGLGLVTAYLGGLTLLHGWALERVRGEAAVLANTDVVTLTSLTAMPTLANPTHWLCLVETERSIYRFDVSLLDRSVQARNLTQFQKPDASQAKVIEIAEQDRRAIILRQFARFPLWHVVDHGCLTESLVQLADLRYTEPGQPRGSFSLELPVECPKKP